MQPATATSHLRIQTRSCGKTPDAFKDRLHDTGKMKGFGLDFKVAGLIRIYHLFIVSFVNVNVPVLGLQPSFQSSQFFFYHHGHKLEMSS